MDEMEQLRIESELEKQQVIGRERGGDHRDSGMGGEVDQESKQRFGDTSHQNGSTPGGSNLKRGAINNSLLDLVTDSGSVLGYSLGIGAQDKPSRRGSVGSLGRKSENTSLVPLDNLNSMTLFQTRECQFPSSRGQRGQQGQYHRSRLLNSLL